MSNRISVVIPTITGREDWLLKCRLAYGQTAPEAEIIVIKDAPSCGVAWQEGYAQSTKEFIHFTADDIIPHEGWWEYPSDSFREVCSQPLM